MKVEVGKKYRMRGYPESEVVIFDTNIGEVSSLFKVLAKTKKDKLSPWDFKIYTIEGLYAGNVTTEGDLIEISPYDDFKIDEPIMVSNNGFLWHRRYFAGVRSDGIPMAWEDGYTKWSGYGRMAAWDYCRKPTPEELV